MQLNHRSEWIWWIIPHACTPFVHPLVFVVGLPQYTMFVYLFRLVVLVFEWTMSFFVHFLHVCCWLTFSFALVKKKKKKYLFIQSPVVLAIILTDGFVYMDLFYGKFNLEVQTIITVAVHTDCSNVKILSQSWYCLI